jgi:hypothetical protein
MKSLMLSLVFCSGLVHAETITNLEVKKFNFSYSDPDGEGSAEVFSKTGLKEKGVKVHVRKEDGNFKLSVFGSEEQEFEFKNAPSFLTEADKISVSDFNLSLNQRLLLSLGAGRFNSEKSVLKLDNLSLDCDRNSSFEDEMDQLITGCFQKMSFKSSKFSSQEVNESLAKAITSALNSSVSVNSVDLKVVAGKYNLSADVKADVSGKVKSSGVLSYDAETSVVKLKISEVKFSILNITGKVFDELEKKETDKLKVERPYVYFKIK